MFVALLRLLVECTGLGVCNEMSIDTNTHDIMYLTLGIGKQKTCTYVSCEFAIRIQTQLRRICMSKKLCQSGKSITCGVSVVGRREHTIGNNIVIG